MRNPDLSSVLRQAHGEVSDKVMADRYWLVRNALQRTANDLERAWEQDRHETPRIRLLREEYERLCGRLKVLETYKKALQL